MLASEQNTNNDTNNFFGCLWMTANHHGQKCTAISIRSELEKTGVDTQKQPRTLVWCPGEDSNLHGFHHWYLKPARLPIPPPGPQ